METQSCSTCFKPKAKLHCQVCAEPTCKQCAQFLSEDEFPFLRNKPEILNHTLFCATCFAAHAEPEKIKYDQTLESAKDIMIFLIGHVKQTRYIKRIEDEIFISDSESRDDVIMNLAFQAALGGHNAVIDIKTDSRKVKSGSFSTTKWTGSGIPVHLDPDKLVKDRSFSEETPSPSK